MAEMVFNNAKLILGGFDMSGQHNTLTLNYSAEMLDRTCFGSSARKRKAGLSNVEFRHSGYFGTTDTDKNLYDFVGSTGKNVSFTGGTAIGDPAFLCKGIYSEYSLGGTIGDLMGFDVAGVGIPASPALVQGKIIVAKGGATNMTSEVSTACNIGVGTTAQKFYVSAHTYSWSTVAGGAGFHGIIQVSASSNFSTATNWLFVWDGTTYASTHDARWFSTKAPTTKGFYRFVGWSCAAPGSANVSFMVTGGLAS